MNSLQAFLEVTVAIDHHVRGKFHTVLWYRMWINSIFMNVLVLKMRTLFNEGEGVLSITS